MKIYAMLFLSLFLGKSCSNQSNNDMKAAIIEYTANTRGFYQKIVIQNQIVSVSKDRSGTEKPIETKISDKDWKELTGCFERIELDSLATLKAPTEKRFHDGAAIGSLKIIYKDKTYESSAFDHGYPPEAIKKFVAKINSFTKK